VPITIVWVMIAAVLSVFGLIVRGS
jgi:hypothetical protein